MPSPYDSLGIGPTPYFDPNNPTRSLLGGLGVPQGWTPEMWYGAGRGPSNPLAGGPQAAAGYGTGQNAAWEDAYMRAFPPGPWNQNVGPWAPHNFQNPLPSGPPPDPQRRVLDRPGGQTTDTWDRGGPIGNIVTGGAGMGPQLDSGNQGGTPLGNRPFGGGDPTQTMREPGPNQANPTPNLNQGNPNDPTEVMRRNFSWWRAIVGGALMAAAPFTGGATLGPGIGMFGSAFDQNGNKIQDGNGSAFGNIAGLGGQLGNQYGQLAGNLAGMYNPQSLGGMFNMQPNMMGAGQGYFGSPGVIPQGQDYANNIWGPYGNINSMINQASGMGGQGVLGQLPNNLSYLLNNGLAGQRTLQPEQGFANLIGGGNDLLGIPQNFPTYPNSVFGGPAMNYPSYIANQQYPTYDKQGFQPNLPTGWNFSPAPQGQQQPPGQQTVQGPPTGGSGGWTTETWNRQNDPTATMNLLSSGRGLPQQQAMSRTPGYYGGQQIVPGGPPDTQTMEMPSQLGNVVTGGANMPPVTSNGGAGTPLGNRDPNRFVQPGPYTPPLPTGTVPTVAEGGVPVSGNVPPGSGGGGLPGGMRPPPPSGGPTGWDQPPGLQPSGQNIVDPWNANYGNQQSPNFMPFGGGYGGGYGAQQALLQAIRSGLPGQQSIQDLIGSQIGRANQLQPFVSGSLQSILHQGLPNQVALQNAFSQQLGLGQNQQNVAAGGANTLQGLTNQAGVKFPQPGIQGQVGDQLSNMIQSGGLSPQYVQAMRQLVLQPQMEALQGRLNAQGGGQADMSSPLFQELQRRQERDFSGQLIQQGMNNFQQTLGQGLNLGQQQFGQPLAAQQQLFGQGLQQSQLQGQQGQQGLENALNMFGAVPQAVAPYLNMAGQQGGQGIQNALQAFNAVPQNVLPFIQSAGNLGLNMQNEALNRFSTLGGQGLNMLNTVGNLGQIQPNMLFQGAQQGLGVQHALSGLAQGNVGQMLNFLQQQGGLGLGQADLGASLVRSLLSGQQQMGIAQMMANRQMWGGLASAGINALPGLINIFGSLGSLGGGGSSGGGSGGGIDTGGGVMGE